MELWIRSQDKTRLVKVEHIYYMENMFTNDVEDKYYICSGGAFDLGVYSTKERALEVLDQIESVMKTNCGFELYSRTGVYPNEFNKKWNCVPVYEMPEE